MKRILILLVLSVVGMGCETQVADPNSNLVPLDAKCLLSSQWGVDYTYNAPYAYEYWMADPAVNFNADSTGFMKLGILKGTWRDNQKSLFVYANYIYRINGGRIIFDIQSVKTFNTFLIKQEEFFGQEAIDYASQLFNLEHLGKGQACECTAKTLHFLETDESTVSPIETNYWKRLNYTNYPN